MDALVFCHVSSLSEVDQTSILLKLDLLAFPDANAPELDYFVGAMAFLPSDHTWRRVRPQDPFAGIRNH